jgi:hypothetical protein
MCRASTNSKVCGSRTDDLRVMGIGVMGMSSLDTGAFRGGQQVLNTKPMIQKRKERQE